MNPMRWVPVVLSLWLALLVGLPAWAYAACAPQPANLIASWKGEGNARDQTGAHNGALMNDTGFAPGMVGQAFSFDGVDDYVALPSSASLDPTAAASIVAWVYFDQLPLAAGHFMYVAGKSGGGTDLDIQAETDNRLYFYVAAGTRVGSTTVVQTGQWYHVVGTYTASNQLKMYVNGVLENTVPIVGVTRGMNGNPFAIGQSSVWGGRFFKGRIDEVSLFSRALSDSEIQGIYNAGDAGICVPDKLGAYRSGIWYLDTNGNGLWDGCGTDGCIAWGGDPADKVVLGDWNGTGTTKIGVYRAGTWYLDLNGNGVWNGCGTDACLSWGGDAADLPVVGDWNGSGSTKIGVYRAAAGTWYLDTNGNGIWDGCGTDACIAWGGDAADKPVVGDWNNDGRTKIGVYRAGTWYLDKNGNGLWDGCATDQCLSWGGDPADKVVLGDWNGSGTMKIGVYRPSTGTWYLDKNGNGAWYGCGTDGCIAWGGVASDIPVMGDWNGSGTAKIGVYRASTGTWYLDTNGSGTWDGCAIDGCVSWGGDAADVPIVGKW